MKRISFIALFFLFIASVALFARVIDASMEIDDLKSQVKLQRNALDFLQSINDQTFKTCTINISELESLAKSRGYSIPHWNDGQASVGPFQVVRLDQCVSRIKLVGFP